MYNLRAVVWEITMGCNMRCKHCGSVCENALSDELTEEEANNLCKELIDMKIDFITLSGGEPTVRKDWYKIAKTLSDGGIDTSIITNGWLIDDKLIQQAKKSGVHTICISIDGLEKTHDIIRRQGSFNKSINSLKKIKDNKINTAVITTVSSANISELDRLYDIFNDIGINVWQLQLAMPMGNFKSQNEYLVHPSYVDKIIDFAYDKIGEGITVTLADCIGYYNNKAIAVLQNHIKDDCYWQGCGAGKNSLGILHNGDITGCTSLRSEIFTVGNIRHSSLKEIWENNENFSWNRNLTKGQLEGFCSKCQYGDLCLGGCANSRLCISGDVYGENKYCSFNYEIQQIRDDINLVNDVNELENSAILYLQEEQFQIAELYVSQLLKLDSDNVKYLEWAGFLNYMLNNFKSCYEINNKLLSISSDCFNAKKGLGLSLCRLDKIDKGMSVLYNILNSDESTLETYFDVYSMLISLDKYDEAKQLLDKAKNYDDYDEWRETFDEVYQF